MWCGRSRRNVLLTTGVAGIFYFVPEPEREEGPEPVWFPGARVESVESYPSSAPLLIRFKIMLNNARVAVYVRMGMGGGIERIFLK